MTESAAVVDTATVPVSTESGREILLSAGLIPAEETVVSENTEETIKEEIKEDKEEFKNETKEEKQERRQWQKTAKRVKKQLEELAAWEASFKENPGKALASKGLKLTPKQAAEFMQAHDITIQDWAKAELETPEKKAQRETQRLIDEKIAKLEADQKARDEAQKNQFHEQLAEAIHQDFQTKLDKYALTSALIEDNILTNEYFFAIAQQVQAEYDETGIKPDLDSYFSKQEAELEKLSKAIQKKVKPSVIEAIKKEPTTITLSTKANEVSNVKPISKDPREREEEIMKKFINGDY